MFFELRFSIIGADDKHTELIVYIKNLPLEIELGIFAVKLYEDSDKTISNTKDGFTSSGN